MVESNKHRKLTIRDMMIATAFVAVFCALAIQELRILAAPGKFVSSVGNWAFEVMLICTFGMFGFPLLIAITGTYFLSKSDSPLRGFYALLVFAASVASVPHRSTTSGTIGCTVLSIDSHLLCPHPSFHIPETVRGRTCGHGDTALCPHTD